MQEIYINIFQKTNLIELLEYRIHKTNTVDRLEYLHRNSLQTTKGHVRVPTGFLEASRIFLNTEANIPLGIHL